MKTLLFVDDEPKILQGLQRQLRTMRNEWDMHFIDGGPKALEFMSTNAVDVIVSDMIMPYMDGAELLTEVSKRHPNTVRMVLSGHADREAILRLVGPAHQYLSKPCEAEELRKAISRAFALRDLLDNEQLKQLATRVKSLPSLPTVFAQLSDELRKEEPSLERVSAIIMRDIGMTAKILQLVNSAFFGLPQHISNPGEAAAYLGLATVRSLVLSMEVFAQYDQASMPHFSLAALANHCWVTGALARTIARTEHKDERFVDQCFLAGLLHDVGQLVLVAGLREEYTKILLESQTTHRPLWELEQERLGASHAEVGAYLLGLWGLPNPVVEAVALHHRPNSSIIQEFAPVIAVHVADSLAHHRSAPNLNENSSAIDIEHIKLLGLSDQLLVWRELEFEADTQ